MSTTVLLVSDFVDALSAPIQFMSAAEKRAKQLQGLGFDEKDISEVSVSMKRRLETNATSAAPGGGGGTGGHERGQQQAGTVPNNGVPGGGRQSAQQTTSVQQDSSADKDKKGNDDRYRIALSNAG
jgi:hypothetical protein